MAGTSRSLDSLDLVVAVPRAERPARHRTPAGWGSGGEPARRRACPAAGDGRPVRTGVLQSVAWRRTSRRPVLLVGWGEGLDQVATYLNAQPDAERQLIAVYFPLELNFQGMVRGTVTQFGDQRPVTHVVDYVNAAQREHTPPEVAGLVPVHEVWINGIQYARVFRLDPPRRIRQ